MDDLCIWATQPKGRPAALLREAGIEVLAIESDEGSVDTRGPSTGFSLISGQAIP